ncbi:MAG: Nif3-like dinuclear metal center hexameric protein [Bacteriovoracaceae bacterium]
MTVGQSELLNYLNALLTPELFDDYAPNGLQIEGKKELKRLAFAVSATQESMQQALSWGADGLIVHHGIFWKYQGAKTVTGPWGERLKMCVKNDLNLLAYHLPLDAHLEVGNAAALGKELELLDIQPFALHKKAPLGVKGKFKTPLTASELKIKLNKILNHNIILASSDENKKIQSIGIITGGANNEWYKAQEDGLDAYLTGEISEYNWHDAIEAGIHFFAGGHHATEKFGIQRLMDKIKKDFPQIEVIFFDSQNPA